MRKLFRKATSLLLAAALCLSMAAISPALAADADKAPPTDITLPTFRWGNFKVLFTTDDVDWLKNITKLTVNGTEYTKADYILSTTYKVSSVTYEQDACYVAFGDGFDGDTGICVIAATGYCDLTLKVEKDGYNVTVVETTTPTEPTIPSEPDTPSQDKNPPTSYACGANSGYDFDFSFTDAADWLSAITGVTVNGTDWTKGSSSFSVWNNKNYYIDASSGRFIIGEAFDDNPATCVVTAKGYRDLTLTLDKTKHTATVVEEQQSDTYPITVEQAEHGTVSANYEKAAQGIEVTVTVTPDEDYALETLTVGGVDVTDQVADGEYTFTMPGEAVTVRAAFAAKAVPVPGVVTVNDLSLSTDFFDQDWLVTVKDHPGYVAAITEIRVNDTVWEKKTYDPSSGGSYRLLEDENQIVFAKKDFSGGTAAIPVLKSGDVISVTAKGYEMLEFKLVIDADGKASLAVNDGQGDGYQLWVKLDGSFEAAIVDQKGYDGVSGATGAGSVNKNSAVDVYGVRLPKDQEPEEADWKKLDHSADPSTGYVEQAVVNIVPDTDSGTSEGSDSGMRGVFMPAMSSSLTLDGTPKDPGTYLISVTITDDQGRTATSNALPFRVYTGKELLADQLAEDKLGAGTLKQTQDGKYMWDIMEPWVITDFGSNVAGEENSVRVPAGLKAWYGSHQSGTYGVLGADLAWEQVEAGNIPQTLYIPAGCDLTLVNMEVLSNVRIVVENGGKLTLRDSGVQGIIDVQGGGTFSMNYNDFGGGEFLTGASINGQLRLADGAILENAAIYSHINYLANGDLVDRTSYEPVVTATGNVTVKGQVFIKGDAGGSKIGQAGLRVTDGTLTLADGATLVVYGGEGNVVNTKGGTAVQLENGTITGSGKLVAIGGQVLWEEGGTAVSGTGTISTGEVYLQGATASQAWNAQPGKAVSGDVTITSAKRHIADGSQKETVADDPLEDLYWKPGIDATPPLDLFVTQDSGNSGDNGNTGDNGNSGNNNNSGGPSSGGGSSSGGSSSGGSGSGGSSSGSNTSGGSANTSAGGSASGNIQFSDVKDSDYFAPAVRWAAEQGVTQGVSADQFGSDLACTRGQIVTFLWRAAGSPEPKGGVNTGFADVSPDDYCAKAVAWAVENGITSGVGDGLFAPDQTCTRAQSVTFLHRAAGEENGQSSGSFADVPQDSYYAGAVQWAVENGVTSGVGEGRFAPEARCTRSQIITFLYQTYQGK